MRNIPIFTTELGVASLVLEEIPYKSTAYIRLQSSVDPVAFLEECAQFCCAAGAESVYATGAGAENFPHHTSIVTMCRPKDHLPQTDAYIVPLAEDTTEQWCEIYNLRMVNVDNAATMTKVKLQEILTAGSGFFVYKDQQLIGIGVAKGGTVEVVASVVPGAGCDALLALCSALTEITIKIEVSSTNSKAIRLYERLGFSKSETLDDWYKII